MCSYSRWRMDARSRQNYIYIASLAAATLAFFLFSGSISGTRSALIRNDVYNESVGNDTFALRPKRCPHSNGSRTLIHPSSPTDRDNTVKFFRTHLNDSLLNRSSFSVRDSFSLTNALVHYTMYLQYHPVLPSPSTHSSIHSIIDCFCSAMIMNLDIKYAPTTTFICFKGGQRISWTLRRPPLDSDFQIPRSVK